MIKALKPIQDQLSAMSKREKILMGVTFLTVFGYFSYTFVFEATIKEIMSKTSKIVTLQLQLQRKEEVQRRILSLGGEIKELQTELAEKREKRDRLDREMKARKQIEEILDSLEKTAKAHKLVLENMKVDTKVTTKSSEYEKVPFVPKGAGGSAPETEKKSVRIKYIQNQISISCSSTYQALLKYLDGIKKLPYALSVVNLDVKKPNAEEAGQSGKSAAKAASTGPTYGKDILLSKIDLEIYFK